MQFKIDRIEKYDFFAKTDRAYAAQDPKLQAFHRGNPQDLSLQAAILREKQAYFSAEKRQILAQVLRDQYANIQEIEAKQIDKLLDNQTFTITTAHQPSLLGGPLYFMTKALDAIKLTQTWQANFPDQKFVPIFWFGGEDHDFEEVNHIYLFKNKITWPSAQGGAVGWHKLQDFEPVLAELQEVLGQSPEAQELMQTLRQIYAPHKTLNEATRDLLRHFFAKHGLLVLDPTDARLKALMRAAFERDLLEHTSQMQVRESQEALSQLGFKAQAYVRPINLFWLETGYRSRIESQETGFATAEQRYEWSRETLLELLQTKPERFSPNVVLRPLMQEMVLPNLAYVGGGGELAYWLERKSQFEAYKVPFPLLYRRTSYLFVDNIVKARLDKLNLTLNDVLTQTYEETVQNWLLKQEETPPNFDIEKQAIQANFESIAAKVTSIEPNLANSVLAQQAQLFNALDKLQERLLRELKKRNETGLQQIRFCYDKVFPEGGLQERRESFMAFFLRNPNFFEDLLQATNPGTLVLAEI